MLFDTCPDKGKEKSHHFDKRKELGGSSDVLICVCVYHFPKCKLFLSDDFFKRIWNHSGI